CPKIDKNPVEIDQYVHGEPTIQFTEGERQVFAKEEGLHQAVIIKFSSDTLEVKDLRTVLPKHLGIKRNCLVGLLARRHILLRIEQYEDYVVALSKSISIQEKKLEWPLCGFHCPDYHQIYLPRILLSMASVVGRPIEIDKATQDKTRPSTARVKEFVYDNLPLYCNHCKHQGHNEKNEQFNGEKFQGDLRQILNEKRGLENIDQSIDDNTRVAYVNNNEIAMVEAIKNNGDQVVDSCVQDDTLNTTVTLNCTLAMVSQTLVLGSKESVTSDSVVPVINLESCLVLNPKLPTVGVLSGKILVWPRLMILSRLIRCSSVKRIWIKFSNLVVHVIMTSL
ncbi:hypothetical protein H5410_005588, partial [Solanum commersonii]